MPASKRDSRFAAIWFHPMCGNFTPEGNARTFPSNRLRPRNCGDSALDSKSTCSPRQMPRKGTPRPMASTSGARMFCSSSARTRAERSEEHTSELQSHSDLVCRLLLEKKKKNKKKTKTKMKK